MYTNLVGTAGFEPALQQRGRDRLVEALQHLIVGDGVAAVGARIGAVLPAVAFWEWHFRWELSPAWLRIVVLSMAFIPAYLVFAGLVSVLALRLILFRLSDFDGGEG